MDDLRVMKSIVSLLALTFTCFSSYAQTEAWSEFISSEYTFIGFSDDGAFAAYEMKEELQHQDEVTRVQLYVIDVDKNSYATRPFRFDVDSARTVKYKRASDSVYSVLKNRYHIAGDKKGTAIEFKEAIVIDSMTTRHSVVIAQQQYAVIIKNIPVKGSEEYGVEEVMVQVDLVSGVTKKIIQAPERAPKSWGITNRYSLLAGWYNANKIVLFLNYETAGFEGPGQRHQMIVTGKLK